MKTNIPDKLYLFEGEPILADRSKKLLGADVEYTLTDAFIEKAIGWIDYNNRNGGSSFDGWEKDFKKYMKGE